MNAYRTRLGAAVVLAVCLGAAMAQAAPLTLDNVTAPDAAARLSDKFGVEVSLQGHFNRYSIISFAVEDADAPGGRLQAVNALANALGADFNKEFVIQKAPNGPAPAPHVDTTASMPFARTSYSTKDAIAMVAGLDDATVQGAEDRDVSIEYMGPSTDPTGLINPKSPIDVSGTVTLSSPTLTVAQAAAEIAAQTHTRWQTVYVLTQRVPSRARGGTVIGRTVGGSAIVELASVYYHDAKWQARQQQIADAARQQAQADQQALADQQAAYQQAVQQGTLDVSGNGNSTSGYNNSSQYNNSYGGNGYGAYGGGYGSNYGGYSGSGTGYNPGNNLIISGNTGYGYGNAPIVFGPGNY